MKFRFSLADNRSKRAVPLRAMLCLLAIFGYSVVLGAEPAALERAMKVLETDLNSLPPTTESLIGRDASGKDSSLTETQNYSSFVVSPRTCVISFHIRITYNGRVVTDEDERVAIKDPTIFDLNEAQLFYHGIPNLKSFRVEPQHFTLRLHGSSGAFNYHFRDVHTAARVWAEMASVFQMCAATP